MPELHLKDLCSTTQDLLMSTASSVSSYISDIPTGMWVVFAALTGLAVGQYYKHRQVKKQKANKKWLSWIKGLKGRIRFRLLNGIHKDKSNFPSGDVLVSSPNVKSLVKKMRDKKEQDKKMHTL